VKASVRLKSNQTNVLQDLAKALHCNENLDGLAIACIKMVPSDQTPDNGDIKITVQSSLLFQELLDFNKPIQVVRSLLAVDSHTLMKIFSDRNGTHILNRFVTSLSIGEKSRDALVKQLRGEYVDLACTKHGCFAIQKLWEVIGIKSREMIAQELANKANLLRNHEFGRFVHTTFAIGVFKHQRSEWNQVISKAEKEKKLFKDILEVKTPNKRKNEGTKESKGAEDIEEPNNHVENEEPKEVTKKEAHKEAMKRELTEEDIKKEEPKEESEPPAKKKKKKKETSYLDDL